MDDQTLGSPGEHPNATSIRSLFAAFRARDLAAIRESLAETAVWHFPGREGLLAGSHVGHAAIFEFLGRVSSLTEGSFALDLEEVLANDRLAVVFFRDTGAGTGASSTTPRA